MTMSTMIQTCIESQFMETSSSQVLKLKVPLNNRDDLKMMMKSNITNVNVCANIATNNHNDTRSFLQFLSNISSPKEENVYFHPLSKSTSSRLSEQSLQLCTENLGCETGSFICMDTTNINNLSLSSSPIVYNHASRKEQVVVEEGSYSYSYSYSIKKVKSYSAFPPPLTTMSGDKSIQIRTNREGGRLITKAIEIPNQESCFVADRSDGRLRLRVFKDLNVDDEHMQLISTQEENQDEDVVDHENEIMYKEDFEQHDVLDVDVDDDDKDADDDGENCKQIMSKEVVIVESSYDVVEVEKIGKEKIPRRFVRCKECSKGVGNNWEPLWVATS